MTSFASVSKNFIVSRLAPSSGQTLEQALKRSASRLTIRAWPSESDHLSRTDFTVSESQR
jgi:hypothetical protein